MHVCSFDSNKSFHGCYSVKASYGFSERYAKQWQTILLPCLVCHKTSQDHTVNRPGQEEVHFSVTMNLIFHGY